MSDLTDVTTRDLSALADDDLIEAIVGTERAIARVMADQLAAITELARRRRPDADGSGPGGDKGLADLPAVSEFVAAEIAAALHLSRSVATERLSIATSLAARLPGTAESLRVGDVDFPRARAIVRATTPLPGDAALAVEKLVLPAATVQTVGQLRARLTQAVLAVDPDGAEERHERAVARRRVRVLPADDGMAELRARLAADQAIATFGAIDEAARARPEDDDRPLDARRADALVRMIASAGGQPTGSAAEAAAPTEAGCARCRNGRPLVYVTVPITTLLDAEDAPGDLAGYGSIPASMARRIASSAVWRRVLTDPVSGTVLDVGRTTYTPPAALAEHVRIRDRTCRFPGCRQPAVRCDLDHTVPYPRGATCAANLCALCRYHHRLKQSAGWNVEQQPDGAVVWTSPSGRRYRTEPEAVGPPLIPRKRRFGEDVPTQQGDPPDGSPPGDLDVPTGWDLLRRAVSAGCRRRRMPSDLR